MIKINDCTLCGALNGIKRVGRQRSYSEAFVMKKENCPRKSHFIHQILLSQGAECWQGVEWAVVTTFYTSPLCLHSFPCADRPTIPVYSSTSACAENDLPRPCTSE